MPQSPSPETSSTPAAITTPAKAPSWLATLGLFCAIVCTNVGYICLLDYYCGLTWRFPVTAGSMLGVLLADALVFVIWMTTLHGGVLKTLALLPSIILSFYIIFYVGREYRPFSRGLTEALHRTDLGPLRQWAAAHRPPKSDFPTRASVENNSVPEEVWRTIPFHGGRPYMVFHPLSEEDDWGLIIDHSLGGFMYNHGFILILGKDIEPSENEPVISPRRVAPYLWVFPGWPLNRI